jgi:hypothetical protein
MMSRQLTGTVPRITTSPDVVLQTRLNPIIPGASSIKTGYETLGLPLYNRLEELGKVVHLWLILERVYDRYDQENEPEALPRR